MSSNGTLPLSGVRARAAAALAPSAEGGFDVLADLPDSVHPPALLLEWNDPWVAVRTVGNLTGHFEAQLNVLCLAGRVDAGAGIETLEEMVAYTLARMYGDNYSWALAASQSPREFVIAKVPLLGARLTFRVPVAVG